MLISVHPILLTFVLSDILKCSINEEIICLITKEKVLGQTDVTDLLKKISAIYYLCFYNYQVNLATDREEADYMNEKYKYSKISKCITKLGIDIQEVLNILND